MAAHSIITLSPPQRAFSCSSVSTFLLTLGRATSAIPASASFVTGTIENEPQHGSPASGRFSKPLSTKIHPSFQISLFAASGAPVTPQRAQSIVAVSNTDTSFSPWALALKETGISKVTPDLSGRLSDTGPSSNHCKLVCRQGSAQV